MKTTIIVTSYRRPKALELVLQSLVHQERPATQVIIADDGSDAMVREVIRKWADRLPLDFVWQPDGAFRAARIRNLALSRAKCEHVVFIDGDCLLPPSFIRAHQQLIQRNLIVAGGRFLLSPEETRLRIESGAMHSKETFGAFKFRTLPLGPIRDLGARSWQQVRTCNMGVLRGDMLSVGGFDESYEGWGREDSDLVVRMLNKGMRIRSARFAACVAHLHHDEASRDALTTNDARFSQILEDLTTVFPRKSVMLNV